VLATRVDLFEPEWVVEFSKLQDSAPAAPRDEVHRQLTEDLGAPPRKCSPLLIPSRWQPPRSPRYTAPAWKTAVRWSSRCAAPASRPIVEADLRWLERLAHLAEVESQEVRAFHPLDVVRQFAQSLRRELDFAVECRNAERIAENFVGYSDRDGPNEDVAAEAATEPPPIIIPRVYWSWTGERICVQEFIAGIPGRDLQAVDLAGLDRKLLARRGAHAVLKMVVEDGLFHADPHSGNVFYLPGNRIAIIDFGMVGRLTRSAATR